MSRSQMVNTIAQVSNNYYNIVRQKQQLNAIREQMGVSEERVRLADRRLQVGNRGKARTASSQSRPEFTTNSCNSSGKHHCPIEGPIERIVEHATSGRLRSFGFHLYRTSTSQEEDMLNEHREYQFYFIIGEEGC